MFADVNARRVSFFNKEIIHISLSDLFAQSGHEAPIDHPQTIRRFLYANVAAHTCSVCVYVFSGCSGDVLPRLGIVGARRARRKRWRREHPSNEKVKRVLWGRGQKLLSKLSKLCMWCATCIFEKYNIFILYMWEAGHYLYFSRKCSVGERKRKCARWIRTSRALSVGKCIVWVFCVWLALTYRGNNRNRIIKQHRSLRTYKWTRKSLAFSTTHAQYKKRASGYHH